MSFLLQQTSGSRVSSSEHMLQNILKIRDQERTANKTISFRKIEENKKLSLMAKFCSAEEGYAEN